MDSLVGYGMLAFLLVNFWAKTWQMRIAIVSATAVLILAIGMSRLYLGVHYFRDVVGGYAAGGKPLSVCRSASLSTQGG